jgi:glycosyltransferase involved in cell wall biosynthesis
MCWDVLLFQESPFLGNSQKGFFTFSESVFVPKLSVSMPEREGSVIHLASYRPKIMHVLIISFTFPPNKDGVSEAAAAMAKGFLDRRWEVSVFTRNTVPAREQLSWHGAELIEYDYGGTFHKPEVILNCGNLDYAAFLKSQKWDVLVFHAYEGSLLCALPHIREIPGRKILVSHGYAALLWEKSLRFPYGLASVGRRLFRSIAMIRWMRSFDRIVYLSEQADLHGFYDHFLAKATGYKGRWVMPNGIDLSERGDANSGFRLMNGIPEDAFVLLCVANYSPRKDQAYGARAFRKAALPGAVLVFIGSEFNEHSRRFQAEDSGNLSPASPGSIIWMEKQSRQATLDALASCDAFLLSAYHEAQPISLLEAMRESKPWIARKAGCIARMEGGICVNSEARMAAAIQRLAVDRELRECLGREGSRAVATRYNRKAYTESYCKLIEELTSDL